VSEAELIVDLAGAESLADEWDALAVACAAPASSPSWMLAWWRHVAPASAELRLVAVRDRDRLIGVVPLFVDPAQGSGLRLLAYDFSSSVTPLAGPDREWEVAEAAAAVLAEQVPSPESILLAPMPADSVWPMALRERMPGPIRPVLWQLDFDDALTVSLRFDSFDDWLQSRSPKFRTNARRRMSKFAKAGGTERLSTAATLAEDIDTFVRLHGYRWEALTAAGAGTSRLLDLGERLPVLLSELADTLLPADRFHLRVLELDGQPIAAELSIAAGGEVDSVNWGWDTNFGHLGPLQISLLSRVREGIERGEHRLTLGRGVSEFKRGFGDGYAPVAHTLLVPPGPSLPAALARSAPGVLRRRVRGAARRALSPSQYETLRAARARLRSLARPNATR
jgi:CelD/BcsL family acetyltransferase involved in cellulose biosynthesis